MQPWYLDAICDEGTWEAVVLQENGRIIGVWPYFLKKWGPWKYVAMPRLARFMGPFLLPEYRNPRDETRRIALMLESLPMMAGFEQDFNYSATNWMPLYWAGFRQTTRYSYVLDITDLNRVWGRIKPGYRNQKIPRAMKSVRIETESHITAFYEVHNRTFSRQNMPPPYPLSFLTRLDAVFTAHKCRKIMLAVDRVTGEIHSGAYLIWDDHAAYLLLSGHDPALRSSGAGILLIWEAIRYSAEVLHLPEFDFTGSMIRPVELVRREFGAEQRPYFRVTKAWAPMWGIAKYLLRSKW
jgi:hypothetical protein